MPKVLISTSSFAEYDASPIELLKRNGFRILKNPYGRRLKEKESLSLLKDVEGLIAGTEILSKEILKSSKSLKVISRCGSGLDNIDVTALKELGIKIYSVPDVATEAMAELTLALILDSCRKITKCDREVRKGMWNKQMGMLLEKKTLGILGLGRIGIRLAELSEPFRLQTLAYDISPDKENAQRLNIKFVPLEELLHEADIISIHISYSPAAHHLIGREEIDRMKRGAILINTSRGGIVDEEALLEALKVEHIGVAALDVFEGEPYQGELRFLDNVILTPHVGSYAKEARIAMEREAVSNLIKGFELLRREKV